MALFNLVALCPIQHNGKLYSAIRYFIKTLGDNGNFYVLCYTIE